MDQLPNTTQWIYDKVTVTGDAVDEDGKPISEDLDLWRRDPVECIQELIGNPMFRDALAYGPERVYSDEEMVKRIVDEMWTADWWWDLQVNKDFKEHIRHSLTFTIS